MYVCICNAVTDKQIRKACDQGATTIEDLSRELKVATCCGRCSDCAKNILSENVNLSLVPPSMNVNSLVPA